MDIELDEGAKLPRSRVYQLSKKEEDALRDEVEKGLKTGKIRRSKAMGACPVLFVKKPGGELRMCVDYRQVNAVSKGIKSALPLINDVFRSIGQAKSNLYTKLDLKGAFHLLRMKKGKESLTAFLTKFGVFEYRVVPFGLKNAPAHFQEVMNRIFHDLLHRGLVVYLDDLLIYEKDPAKHRQLVEEVLERLQRFGLLLSPEKCQFEVPRVSFLGHELSQDGVSMMGSKLDAIKRFPDPKNLKQLQSWLGLTNYSRAFIPGYSETTIPLTQLLKKDSPFVFSGACKQAMEALKENFISLTDQC